MFDIGFWEIALIMVLALVILGPEKLPHAARTIGHFVGKARRYIEGVKSEVEKEFDSGELKRMMHNQEVQIRELQGKLTETGSGLNQDYNPMSDDDDPGNAHQSSESDYEVFEQNSDEYDDLAVTSKADDEEISAEIEQQSDMKTVQSDKSV